LAVSFIGVLSSAARRRAPISSVSRNLPLPSRSASYVGIAATDIPGYQSSVTVSPKDVAPGFAVNIGGFGKLFGSPIPIGGQLGTGTNGGISQEVGIGNKGFNISIYYAFDPRRIAAAGGKFSYISTPSTFRPSGPIVSQGGIPYSFSPTSGSIGNQSAGGGGGITIYDLSRAVVQYASTPGANYADANFIGTLRAVNEYNNALITSKN
jgi:hypothetical protein